MSPNSGPDYAMLVGSAALHSLFVVGGPRGYPLRNLTSARVGKE